MPLSTTRLWPDEIMGRIEQTIEGPDEVLAASVSRVATELLAIGEASLQRWLTARGLTPTTGSVEGFRLLALQRQGARGDPSFNACRETCRELVYYHNLLQADPAHGDTLRRLRLGARVARHLALFIDGKLEHADLGTFCCSSRPLRRDDAPVSDAVMA